MKHYRRHDPLGLPVEPNLVTDPDRAAELTAEQARRLKYLFRTYHAAKQLELSKESFNTSMARLKRAVARKRPSKATGGRLDPRIELAINLLARELADLKVDEMLTREHDAFVQQAACQIANRSKLLRGARGSAMLIPYVEGAIAVYQEATGKSLMGPRDTAGEYDPHLTGVGGEFIRLFVDQLERGIPDTVVTYWIRKTRKEFSGKHLRFQDLFPAYGASNDPQSGEPVLEHPYVVEAAGVIMPIYCP